MPKRGDPTKHAHAPLLAGGRVWRCRRAVRASREDRAARRVSARAVPGRGRDRCALPLGGAPARLDRRRMGCAARSSRAFPGALAGDPRGGSAVRSAGAGHGQGLEGATERAGRSDVRARDRRGALVSPSSARRRAPSGRAGGRDGRIGGDGRVGAGGRRAASAHGHGRSPPGRGDRARRGGRRASRACGSPCCGPSSRCSPRQRRTYAKPSRR